MSETKEKTIFGMNPMKVLCRFHVGGEPGILLLVFQRLLVVPEWLELRDPPRRPELSVRYPQRLRRQNVDQPAHFYRVDGLLGQLFIGT